MPWWREAVFYQIYPRSFADGNHDGIGDLLGIREKLPYLRWLGVDAIWISPVYRSPMADGGYDIADYRDVDPLFGTLSDFDALLTEAHGLGLRVLVDFVPNHTSSEHPWFGESRSSRDNPKRGWYVWRDGRGDEPPNNWLAAFGGRAWTFDETTGQWYLHLFLPEQPDLDWSNPEVVAAMHDVLRFWLERGVDGFRVDVVHLIGKDPTLPDHAPELADIVRVGVHDYEGTHELVRGLRRVLEEYGDSRILVGEVSLRDTLRISSYYGEGDELHLAFNFLSLDVGWTAHDWRALVAIVGRDLHVNAWPTWVLSNHDDSRHRTRYGGSEQVARAAAILLLTLRGTPFVYQGEELGLEDVPLAAGERIDPGLRDGSRAPIPWTANDGHGWSCEPWLPFPPDAARRSVEAQRHDPGSMLNLYRSLLRLRKTSAALRAGTLELVDSPDDVLCFLRASENGEDVRLVAVNFAERPAAVDALVGRHVDVSSAPWRRSPRHDGVLLPHEAVVVSGVPSSGRPPVRAGLLDADSRRSGVRQ